jgi:hypothetical protein
LITERKDEEKEEKPFIIKNEFASNLDEELLELVKHYNILLCLSYRIRAHIIRDFILQKPIKDSINLTLRSMSSDIIFNLITLKNSQNFLKYLDFIKNSKEKLVSNEGSILQDFNPNSQSLSVKEMIEKVEKEIEH